MSPQIHTRVETEKTTNKPARNRSDSSEARLIWHNAIPALCIQLSEKNKMKTPIFT